MAFIFQSFSEQPTNKIEHSRNGATFENIGRVAGQGHSVEPHDYQFLHEDPGSGIHYYRLRQVDFDGHFAFSKIVNVRFTETAGLENLVLHPNPNNGTLRFSGTMPEGARIRVSDSHGSLRLDIIPTMPTLDLSNLPAGLYFLEISNENQRVFRKVVKI